MISSRRHRSLNQSPCGLVYMLEGSYYHPVIWRGVTNGKSLQRATQDRYLNGANDTQVTSVPSGREQR